jgi:hypothetical protein
MDFYRPDSVYEVVGIGVFVGPAAIREFLDEWEATYEAYDEEIGEVLNLGNGVVLALLRLGGRPSGSAGHVRVQRSQGFVCVWEEGKVMRAIVYFDPDEARAAAERLAQERG